MGCPRYIWLIMLVLLMHSHYILSAGRKMKIVDASKHGSYTAIGLQKEPVLVSLDRSSVDLAEQEADRYYLAPLTQEITPETTIFAFDLHDVIFQKLLSERVGYSLRAIHRGMIWYMFNPFFWYNVRKISTQTAIWEDFFNQLVEKYPGLKKFEDDFYAAANAFKPIQSMVDIIAQLHKSGYKLYILSNIGGKTFTLFKEKFPELFSYFSGAYTPCQDNNYNCKPNISFYTEFKEHIYTLGDTRKQCIFIDDIETNLQAAIASNKFHAEFIMGGVHCTSVERVKAVLQDIGVLAQEEIQTEIAKKCDGIVENV